MRDFEKNGKSEGKKNYGKNTEKRFGDKKTYGDKKFGDRKPYSEKKADGGKFNNEKKYGDKKYSGKKFGDNSFADKKFENKKSFNKFNVDKENGKFSGKKFTKNDRFENIAEAPADRFEKRENPDELHENMLEGRNPIREALKAGRNIERLLVAEGEIQGSVKELVYDAKVNGAIIQEVERARLDRMSVTGTHQGVIAFVAMKDYCSVEDILAYAKEKNEDPFIVVLDGICDPQNLGAIIRSAECAGVHGVIIQERRAVGLTPVVAKCSAGAIEYMHIARVTNISQTVEKLKKNNIWVYGASMEGKTYSKMNMKGACALVIGSEGDGISPLVKKNCDCLISMPQLGHIDSLNASVAAGILMYDVLRQRSNEN